MVDLIQHRYGWTDEVVFSLPYARFLDICELVIERANEDKTEGYRRAAYTAYLRSGLEDTSFGQYLESLGIGENQAHPQDKKVTKEQAVNKAHDILAKFQAKK
jgi:hypothetical protein